MSSPSVKAENGSKVLPGDKSGLLWEIWRIILSYLSAEDLCGSACVCKTWNDLVVVKNRIHSKSDKAITISKGQIHDNTLFKGLRDPLQCSSDSNDDLNTSKHGKDFSLLKDPTATPHIEAPPTIIRAPANQITTVTRITIPSDNQCQDGSRLCIIL